MTHQQEFDRLRQDCSTTLAQFISAAHETERQMQNLQLIIGADENLEFLSLRRAEFAPVIATLWPPTSSQVSCSKECSPSSEQAKASLRENRRFHVWLQLVGS